jgi:hypothetical protein
MHLLVDSAMPARFPEIAHVAMDGPRINTAPPEIMQMPVVSTPTPWPPGEEVVIAGISGRLPESDNIEEFRDQLFAGVDLITDDERRWPSGRNLNFQLSSELTSCNQL